MLKINNGIQRFTKLVKVPFTDLGLCFVPITSFVLVRVIANVVRVKVLHPSIRPVVDSKAQDAHVVRV